jgi:hypothetical protein
MLPKNARIKTNKNIILPLVLYGCKSYDTKGRTQTEGA